MSPPRSPLLKSWHWEAVLLPMPREVQRQAIASVSKGLRQLSTRPEFADLKIETGELPLLYSTRDGKDEFDLEILEDLVAYQYEPESPSEQDFVRHLRYVAEPVMNEVIAGVWLENVVLRTVVAYRLELVPARGDAALERLFELTQVRPELPGFADKALIGLDLSLGYETKVAGWPVELWVDLGARRTDLADDADDIIERDDDAVETSVFVQTLRGDRPQPRWMTNLVEIHEALWPRILRLFGGH